MKERLKRPLRAFAFIWLSEVIITLFTGTVAWAIAKHDLNVLDQSFYHDVRTERYAQIVGALLALIALANLFGVLIAAFKKGKSVFQAALAAMIMTGAIASLFVLPMRFTVYGLGGVVGLAIVYKVVLVLYAMLSWPFRKIFRKKAKDEKSVTETDPKPQTKSKPAPGGKGT